jgi:hypothetical protein
VTVLKPENKRKISGAPILPCEIGAPLCVSYQKKASAKIC